MPKIQKLPEGTFYHWIDPDHFVYGNQWYRVTKIGTKGRVHGETYWIDEEDNELIAGRLLTCIGVADTRPNKIEIEI